MEDTERERLTAMQNSHVVRLLGPIDILTPAGPVAVGGFQSRALLGALAIGAQHAVSIDYLSLTMWGDNPPASAGNTLQSYVSHLRGILGAEAIIRVDHSYELIASAQNIDALVFERLVGDAFESKDRPDECLSFCRKALALWRGRPFGELADDEGFRLEAYRLNELRLVAMELALGAELSLGHHEIVVGELESAVEEHPYREQLWYLLIEALARCGRRVEALRACGRLRRVLAEVGLESTDELISIEQNILAGRS
jgi:DNA-binding SARP family transcriptional activator